jgi:hypothetical protein
VRLVIARLLATALVGLTPAAASACGEAAPDVSAGPTASAAADDAKTACAAVMKARKTALDALAPVSTALAQAQPSATDIAKATDDVKRVFTAMHVDVAAAAEQAGDPQLEAKIAAYQLSIEQAIVVVEGADGDKTELASAIDLPELRSAEAAVMAACA